MKKLLASVLLIIEYVWIKIIFYVHRRTCPLEWKKRSKYILYHYCNECYWLSFIISNEGNIIIRWFRIVISTSNDRKSEWLVVCRLSNNFHFSRNNWIVKWFVITLHRLLAFDPKTNKFKYNEDNLLDAKLILVDEVSMIDLLMFNNLLRLIVVRDSGETTSMNINRTYR